MAMIALMMTSTTIATCIQIQKGFKAQSLVSRFGSSQAACERTHESRR
jgi:hypothetical protein